MGLGPVTVGPAAYDVRVRATSAASPRSRPAATRRRRSAGVPGHQGADDAAFVDEQLEIMDQLLAIFYVLLALAVIVSLFGIVNTLVLATFERTRELGTLRAVGMTRRQVRRMVRHESIITALHRRGARAWRSGSCSRPRVTSAFAEEGLAFAVPAGSLIAFAVVAVVAGVLAAVLPARRAARTNVLVGVGLRVARRRAGGRLPGASVGGAEPSAGRRAPARLCRESRPAVRGAPPAGRRSRRSRAPSGSWASAASRSASENSGSSSSPARYAS